MATPWIVFFHGDKELASYTVKGTYPGELHATRELLAAEIRCEPKEIDWFIKWRRK